MAWAAAEYQVVAELGTAEEWEGVQLLAAVVEVLGVVVSPSDRAPLHHEVARRSLAVEPITAPVPPSMRARAADYPVAAWRTVLRATAGTASQLFVLARTIHVIGIACMGSLTTTEDGGMRIRGGKPIPTAADIGIGVAHCGGDTARGGITAASAITAANNGGIRAARIRNCLTRRSFMPLMLA